MNNKRIFVLALVLSTLFMMTSCTSNKANTKESFCPCGCNTKDVCEMVKNCPMKDKCPMKDTCLIKKACETNNMDILKEGSCPCKKDKCPLKANGCKCKQNAVENSTSCKGMKMAMNDKNNIKDEDIEVTDFESWVKAGGLILKTFPPKCKDPKTGKVYTKITDDTKNNG